MFNVFRHRQDSPPVRQPTTLDITESLIEERCNTEIRCLRNPAEVMTFINNERYFITSSSQSIAGGKGQEIPLGDLGIATQQDRIIHIEIGASFCTLCLSVDREGNRVNVHEPITSVQGLEITGFSKYKEIVAGNPTFRNNSTTFILGQAVNVSEGTAHIASRVQSYLGLPHCYQITNPSDGEVKGYQGYVFIPCCLSTDGQNKILLIPFYEDRGANRSLEDELGKVFHVDSRNIGTRI